MTNNKALGRGLSAFLDMKSSGLSDDRSVTKLNIDSIKKNPFQPRQTFDEESIASLSESIKRRGVLQPIMVIRLEDGGYQLVAGERRLRAAKMAGLVEITALIADLSAKDQLEVAILENIQRENLNPLEEAEAYRRLIDEFHHTQEDLAEIFGKSRSYIANALRLLSLPNDVKSLVIDGKLSAGHARTLVGSANAVQMAKQVVEQSLNVRQTEEMMRGNRSATPQQRNSRSNSYVDPEILNITAQISSLVSLETRIKLKGSGGTIEMDFKNFEELDDLLKRLNP
jgi:ParB family chromosome partitioning protein